MDRSGSLPNPCAVGNGNSMKRSADGDSIQLSGRRAIIAGILAAPLVLRPTDLLARPEGRLSRVPGLPTGTGETRRLRLVRAVDKAELSVLYYASGTYQAGALKEIDDFMRDRGCEACHGEDSWGEVAFDHRLESFALEGKHRDVACGECHPRLPEEAPQCVQLRGVPLTCAGCHEKMIR